MRWKVWLGLLVFASPLASSIAAAQSSRSRKPEPPPAPIEYPHPLITEILYDVPEGSRGDASGDGVREPTGDEFIEITNPHSRSISIGGYTLTDRNHPGRAGFSFQFPALKLRPGESAVVFNGLDTRIRGSVGTAERRARASKDFNGAYVFTALNESSSVGLANSGDWVLLSTHRGRPVHCVFWGEFEADLPRAPGLILERAGLNERGSVHRAPTTPADASSDVPDAWSKHHDHDGLRFSPGVLLETEPTPGFEDESDRTESDRTDKDPSDSDPR